MEPMILENWTAQRSGGAITVSGVDRDTGKPVKVTNVEKIECIRGEGLFVVISDKGAVPKKPIVLATPSGRMV